MENWIIASVPDYRVNLLKLYLLSSVLSALQLGSSFSDIRPFSRGALRERHHAMCRKQSPYMPVAERLGRE